MSKQLEQYLESVSVGLRRLPPEEREKEIIELRQHLEALVQARREVGDGEEVAVAGATTQFGQAHGVRRRLAWAYYRRQGAAFQQSWLGAILCPILYAVLITMLFSGIVYPLADWLAGGNEAVFLRLLYVVLIAQCGLIGWLSGRFCGWRSLLVIVSWSSFFYDFYMAPQFHKMQMPGEPFHEAVWLETATIAVIGVAAPLAGAIFGLRSRRTVRKA